MSVFGLAVVVYSTSAQAKTILRCEGFSRHLNGTVAHTVALFDTYATWDDQRYTLKSTQALYYLWGPVGDWDPETSDPPPLQIHIDRMDGSYLVVDTMTVVLTKQPIEWSRPEDKGCFVERSKF